MDNLFAGLDVGTTNIKCCIFSSRGEFIASASRVTPWNHNSAGIEMQAPDLMAVVQQVLDEIDSNISSQIEAFGITGMAEAGLVLSAKGDVLSPILAWNDARPDSVVNELFSKIDGTEFSGITGLPSNSRATIAKLLWLQQETVLPSHAQWIGIPEWVAYSLGAKIASERSLASRTGLYDVLGDYWREDFQRAVFNQKIVMPELVSTQDVLGKIKRQGSRFDNAALVVAGHDHMCAAIGTGESNTWNIVDSMGTGEALSKEISRETLSDTKLSTVVAEGMTVGRHPLPNRYSAMVGLGSGLILKGALEIVGISGDFEGNQDSIRHISQESLSATDVPLFRDLDPGAWDIISNGVRHSDAAIWRGALDFVGRRARNGVNLLDRHFDKHTKIIACGGWLKNVAIRETKRAHLGDFEISDVDEPGCFGAALIASEAVGFHDLKRPINIGFVGNK